MYVVSYWEQKKRKTCCVMPHWKKPGRMVDTSVSVLSSDLSCSVTVRTHLRTHILFVQQAMHEYQTTARLGPNLLGQHLHGVLRVTSLCFREVHPCGTRDEIQRSGCRTCCAGGAALFHFYLMWNHVFHRGAPPLKFHFCLHFVAPHFHPPGLLGSSAWLTLCRTC